MHRVRRTALVLCLASIALAGAGCSDDGSGSAGDVESTGEDERVIAYSVAQLTAEDLVLDADTARRHVLVLFQVNGGLDPDQAACATERFVDEFGGEQALDGVAPDEMLSEDTRRARREAARACTPEDPPGAGPTTTVDPFEEAPPEPFSNELDVDLLRDHLVAMTALNGVALGLDADEAGCLALAAYGGLTDAQVLATQRPEAYPDVELPERDGVDEVRACVEEERIAVLGAELRPGFDAATAQRD